MILVKGSFGFMSSFNSLWERPVCEHLESKIYQVSQNSTENKILSKNTKLLKKKLLYLVEKKSIGHSIKLPFISKFFIRYFLSWFLKQLTWGN